MMMDAAGGRRKALKLLSHRMYTELSTALSTANAETKEAHLLLGQVKERFGTLEKQILDLEESHRRIKTEWLDFYDKTHRAMNRIVKRAERSDKIDAAENGGDVPFPVADDDQERFMDPISKRIHSMRKLGR